MAITTTYHYTMDLDKGGLREVLHDPLYTLNSKAHTFAIEVKQGASAASLNGAKCTGYFTRTDGVTVPIDGAVSGNVASVTLLPNCYAVQGHFDLSVDLILGDVIHTILHVDGSILRSRTDSMTTGGSKVQSFDELVSAVQGVEAAMKRRDRVVNLLDNSDFRNPVNQRGLSAYTGDWVYSIDRWMINAANGEVSLSDSGIAISVNEGKNVRLVQRIPFKTVNPNKTYTIAYKRDDGTICCGSGLVNNCTLSDGGIRFAQFTTGIDQEFYYLIIDCYGGTVIEWAVLYEGSYTADTLPEYQPKGYAVELAECQRYHIAPGRQPVQGWCYEWGRLEVHIPLPSTMRLSSPTIIIGSGASGFWVGGTAYSWEYQGCATVPNGIVLYLTHSAGVSGQAIIPELSVSINCDL